MSMKQSAGVSGWLAERTPGTRLWLMVLAIFAGLGALSMLLPAADLPASNAAPKASSAPATHDPLPQANGNVKPGEAGRAVKTIAIAAPSAGKNTPPPKDSKTSLPVQAANAPTQPATKTATATVEGGGSGRPTKAWRTAAAPAATASGESKKAGSGVGAAGDRVAGKDAATSTAKAASGTSEKAVASKMRIQDVKSPGGISAWLVEEHSVPLLALRFVFDGGNSQDPKGKEGVANFITAMMDEGAGDLDAAKFQERAEELAMRMGFEDTRDSLYGSFETLTANREPAMELLRLALTKPRFDKDAVERIKKQLLVNLAYAAKNPQRVAAKAWSEAAFAGHPYGRPANGTPTSIKSITSEDLEAYRKRIFARDHLKVVAVGDIDAKTLGILLDRVFGDLPAKGDLQPVADVQPSSKSKLKIIEMDVPQSVVQFGMAGLPRKDPDFLTAYVMNHILGGGGFASRLTEQVREKRGLAYSVYSYLQPYNHSALLAGGVATKNESVKDSIDVIKSELERMAKDGPTEVELASAKSYLTGSFALRFDTNAKIASQLLWMLNEDMGIDYADKRNALVEAVTLEDVKRVAKRVLHVNDLFVTVVGKPTGLNPG